MGVPVGIGIIGRRIHEIQLLLELGEHATHQEGTSGSVCLEIVSNHDGDAPTTFRTSHPGAHLLTKHIGGAPRRGSTIEPPISPVHQAEPIDLAVISRGLDQALPAPPFAAPDPREGRVPGKLDLILERDRLVVRGSASRQGQPEAVPTDQPRLNL